MKKRNTGNYIKKLMVTQMNIEDKKDLQWRLIDFSQSADIYFKITRIEAKYLSALINEDWRK